MHHDSHDKIILKDVAAVPTIALVGNPNVGKSVIFSLLTGNYVTVSNYPGTTVEIAKGTSSFDGGAYRIIDTPGANSLTPRSEDEKVTRDLLLSQNSMTVVQVADSKNLRRSLILTSQLAEMGMPMVLVLNMADEAKSAGISIDAKKLAERLGVPVVETVATEKRGINKLIASIALARSCSFKASNHPYIRSSLEKITDILPAVPVAKQSVAAMILASDESLHEWLRTTCADGQFDTIEAIVKETQSHFREPLGYLMGRRRLDEIDSLLHDVMTTEQIDRSSWMSVAGNLSQHPVFGIPILCLVLYLIYLFVGKFAAGTCVNFIEESIFGHYINPAVVWLVSYLPIPLLRDLLVGKFGLITMGLTYSIAIVLPIVGFFFLAFGILEDTGYLPRLTIMANKGFKVLGMNGKAVLPIVLGLGCVTMATLTTRILDTKKERIMATFLLALSIPCSAQLGVILGILGKLSLSAFVIFVLVILSQLLVVGFLAGKLVPGRASDFIIEIPPFRLPQLSNVILKTISRIEWFLKEAVPIFLLGTFVLFVADKTGVLDALVAAAKPVVVTLLMLPQETAVAFVMGFLRRDYGAAGLYRLYEDGLLNPIQVIVSLVIVTLFVPCIANFFVIIKEHGLKKALAMTVVIFPLAVCIGAIVNIILRMLHYSG
ncbi:MAG: ferrous iron transport protein B [Candidatus Abyssobacteria bacterium SURF_17]|uniref:Ferrous iron transport protein B n=1 Tax=Candidatus Abyssobacteria bacterium SURF_17 TaxID=2093361 RepID=A0A419EW89_9BACT|nr:MAG: ferrous iron transport protein B [Candidatus Abyssubacteria bacterium SURF_17]